MPQLLLLAAVIYVLYRWLRDAPPRPSRPRSSTPPPSPVEEMVQDPACGTWVPLSQAVAARRNGETLHFCSPECREKYLKETSKQ